jgi:protein O-GlcNAc transferase
MSASQILTRAVQHHQAGNLSEAEALYRNVLQLEPRNPAALHMLGVIAGQFQRHDIAINLIRSALHEAPTMAAAHCNLGLALKANGQLDEAVASYRRAIQLMPNYADAHSNLGAALLMQDKLDEAVASLERALQVRPDNAVALTNLGVALQRLGCIDEAISCQQRAIRQMPTNVDAHTNLGFVLRIRGKDAEAVASYEQALRLKPDHVDALIQLGLALVALGKIDEAIARLGQAVRLKPNDAETHLNLGLALEVQGKLDEAVASFRQAALLRPDFADAHLQLALAFGKQGKHDEAGASFQQATRLKPNFAEAHFKQGVALATQGRLDEAIACYRRALELKPDSTVAHSNLLLTLQYCAGVTPAALAEAHAEYERQHAVPLHNSGAPHTNVRECHRPLRLGFVSADLAQHPVGFFLVRVLENLRQTQQETICYSDRRNKDDLTHRLQLAASQWHDVIGISDQQLADKIRSDRIDILFDLAGHTADNRLLVFARKPAPIQITWAGYVGTTGLKAMDYLLADRYEIPPGAERYYQEQVLRMPDGYVCYEPPAHAPKVAPLPALDRGQVTFGCFNHPAKINAQVISVWDKILTRLPGSRLVLRYRGWDVRRFSELFGTRAIDLNRLELLGHTPHADLLAEYNRIDMALDPFPYSGGLTTCEALWMGVPVITCPGETFASRHSFSHLSNVGLMETIAHDLDDYVERAVSLGRDLPRLVALRASLRQRMAASPLCDGQRFAANLTTILRDVWQRWVDQVPR